MSVNAALSWTTRAAGGASIPRASCGGFLGWRAFRTTARGTPRDALSEVRLAYSQGRHGVCRMFDGSAAPE